MAYKNRKLQILLTIVAVLGALASIEGSSTLREGLSGLWQSLMLQTVSDKYTLIMFLMVAILGCFTGIACYQVRSLRVQLLRAQKINQTLTEKVGDLEEQVVTATTALVEAKAEARLYARKVHESHQCVHRSRDTLSATSLAVHSGGVTTTEALAQIAHGHLAAKCSELADAFKFSKKTPCGVSVKIFRADGAIQTSIRDAVSSHERRHLQPERGKLNTAAQQLMALEPPRRRCMIENDIDPKHWTSSIGPEFAEHYRNIMVVPIQFRVSDSDVLAIHRVAPKNSTILVGLLQIDSFDAAFTQEHDFHLAALHADKLYEDISRFRDLAQAIRDGKDDEAVWEQTFRLANEALFSEGADPHNASIRPF